MDHDDSMRVQEFENYLVHRGRSNTPLGKKMEAYHVIKLLHLRDKAAKQINDDKFVRWTQRELKFTPVPR